MTSIDGKLTFARRLRREQTSNERTLWKLLRDRRLDGLKFRRQVPIGRYIADFVCFRHRIVVEADGPSHDHSLRDIERDAWLASQGFRVMRFPNEQIERAPTAVLDAIWTATRPMGDR